jgi:oligopeptidase B
MAGRPTRRAILATAGAAAALGAGYHFLGNWTMNRMRSRRSTSKADASARAPITPRRPVVVRHHGIEVVDDYAWLRTSKWRDVLADPSALEPELQAHLQAENIYADHILHAQRALRRKIAREIESREAEEDESLPDPDGPWLYFTQLPDDAEHEQVCRRPRAGGPTTVLLDGDEEARGASYYELADAIHSPDHSFLAYAVDHSGNERYILRIRDIETGDTLSTIEDASGDFAWALDSRTLFYVRLDTENRPLEVWRHRVGSPSSDDELVHRESNPAYDLTVDRTQSGKFIRIVSDHHLSTEVWLVDAAISGSAPMRVAPRTEGHAYTVEHFGDRLVVLTNSGDAADKRICLGPIAPDAQDAWTELVAGRTGHRIKDMAVLARYCVRVEETETGPLVVARRWSDGREHTVELDPDMQTVDIETGHEFDTDLIRITQSSMSMPERTTDYDLAHGEVALQRSARARRRLRSSHYVTQRMFAPSSDGELVPVTLLHRADLLLDGSAPLFLEGYGAYGDALEPSFEAARLSLVDRGFVFALAHVRGGNEKGENWYAAGRHHGKPQSIRDYIAVAEHLAVERYTSRGRIVAYGESAGGLLVAAALNSAPDLFLGVIADVPFVDVLNTLLDPDLALTPGEWPEFGNPLVSKEDFELIRSYSPYENVWSAGYPPVLAVASLTDQRVTYWEPAKWIARLRERSTSGRPMLLVTQQHGGHGGPSSRSDKTDVLARAYAFAVSLADTVAT